MNELLLQEQIKKIITDPTGFGRNDFVFEGRVQAAVLALFRGKNLLESEILLILRSSSVTLNPGQVALPGGSAETIDEGDPFKTALRETQEEVGLDPENILPLGVLPPLPTVTGNSVVNCVLGVWMGVQEQALQLQPTEVDHAEWVSIPRLIASRSTEQRLVHGVLMELPVFQWGDQRMWGLTAMIFDLILKRYDKLFS